MDLSDIGQQFGLTPVQTKAAFEALAPVVAAGLQRNGNAGGGLTDIIESMTKGQSAGTGALTKHGNDVLGEIFKTKDVSRGVADEVSASTGIGPAILKKMLPIIASIVMAQLAKQMSSGGSSGGGGLGDILGQVLGGGKQSQGNSGGGGLGDILGQILGGAAGGQSGGGDLGDILGQVLGGAGGGQATKAGGSLLDGVEKALRNR
jgi:hypothetical protein